MSQAGNGTLRGRRALPSRPFQRTVGLLAGALLATVAVLGFGGAPEGVSTSALRHIYWTNTATSRGAEGPGVDTVGRASVNGADINRDLVKTQELPGALAVDAKHIYWVDDQGEGVARAAINGTHVNHRFISRGPRAGEFGALLLHGRYIYWSVLSTIGRARIDGTHVERNFVTVGRARGNAIFGLAADARDIYWTNPEKGTIGRVDLSGRHLQSHFIAGVGEPSGLTLDSKHIYWANGRDGNIGRADLSGRRLLKRFIGAARGRSSLALDAHHIYWTNYLAGTIGRADLSGQNVNQSFILAGTEGTLGASAPYGLAVGP